MAEFKLSSVTTSDLTNTESPFTATPQNTDGISNQDEIIWNNKFFSEYYGYYRQIPELQNAINMRSTFAVGAGYECDTETKVALDFIAGNGKDKFLTILRNMCIIRQVNGDAYAEIIRDPETSYIVNLKPLDPSSIEVVFDRNGMIKHYNQVNKIAGKQVKTKFKKESIFHLSRNRVADETHGISVVEACKWIIDARNEAMQDYRTVLRRNVVPLRVIKVDLDDPVKIQALTVKYENLIKNKEVLFIPKDVMEIENVPNALNSAVNPMSWLEQLKGYFYQAVGVPEILMGGGQSFSESSAKISYLGYEQPIKEEQRDLEEQIWEQLQFKIKLTFPTSLKNELLNDEQADGQGSIGFQPNETTAGVGQ